MATKADGSVIIEADFKLDKADVQKELNAVKSEMNRLNKSIAKSEAGKSPLVEQSREYGAALDAARAKLEALRAEQAKAAQYASHETGTPEQQLQAQMRQPEITREIAEQSKIVDDLQKKFDGVADKIDKYDTEIKQSTESLEAAKNKAGELTTELSKGGKKMSTAMSKADKSANKFAMRLSSVIRSALVFTVITQALSKFRDWMGKVIQTNDEAKAAMAKLKGALLTLAQPLINVLIPAFITLVNVVTKVISTLASLMSAIFGTTISQSAEAAEGLYEETEALEGVGGAAKKAGKSMANFDEINQISDKSGGGGGGKNAQTITPDFEFGEAGDSLIDKLKGAAVLAGLLGVAFGKVGAGVGLLVGGIMLLIDAIKDAEINGWNFENTLQAVAGLLMGGLGISLMVGSWIPMLIAAIAGAVLALAAATGNAEDLIGGFKKIIEGFVDFFVGIFKGDLDRAIGGINKIFDGFGQVVDAVIKTVRDSFASLIDWIDKKTNGKLAPVLNGLKGLFTTTFNAVRDNTKVLIEWVKGVFNGLIEFLTGVFTADWDLAWQGVVNIFKSTWNAIIGLLEGAVNLIVKGLNWLISQMNKISFEVPEWVPEVGGKRIGVNIPSIRETKIPKLARGAVIPPNSEFLAVLGDQKRGTNIETPLATMVQAFRQAMGESNFGGSKTVVLEVDKRQFAKVVFDLYGLEDQRVGVTLGGG